MKKILLAAALTALLGGCASAPAPQVVWHQGTESQVQGFCGLVMHDNFKKWYGCSRLNDSGYYEIWSEQNSGEVFEHELRHYHEGHFHAETNDFTMASSSFGLTHLTH